MYPHTITIINLINVKGQLQAHYKTLHEVLYQDKQAVKSGSESQYTDNNGYVQIPHKIEGYLTPEQYKSQVDKTNYWTLQENDYIVKGVVDEVPMNELNDIEGLRTILSIENIDYSIVLDKHYGVYLKWQGLK